MMMEVSENVAAIQQQSTTLANETEKLVDFAKTSEKLAQGILETYQPPVEQMKTDLQELLKKQEILLEKMQTENKEMTEITEDEKCKEMYLMIKAYTDKLTRIKKEMTTIYDRTAKLRKRADRLLRLKQKEAMAKELRKEEEIRREEELIGKPTG